MSLLGFGTETVSSILGARLCESHGARRRRFNLRRPHQPTHTHQQRRRLVRTHNNFSSNEGPVWMPPPREPHTRYSQSCDEETSEIGPDECYSFSNQTATPTAIKQISVSKLLNAT